MATLNFESDLVKLEPLSWQHFDHLLPICLEEPDLLTYSPSHFGTKEYLKQYFEIALDQYSKGLKYSFAIFDKRIQRYVGSTSFMSISEKDKRVEIGSTWLSRKVQRTGLNRQVKYLLLTYAFEEWDMERVELKTDSRNIQSQKAILGIGATFEGKLRSHTVMPDGYRRDTVYFSILKSEWPSIKSSIFSNY